MASLSPSTTTTTMASAPPKTPFLPKSSHLSGFINRTHAQKSVSNKVSCTTYNNNNENPQLQNPNNTASSTKLDRRNMLIGLGGLYGATVSLGGAPDTLADPIAPDVINCTKTDAEWDDSVGEYCCPPKFDLSEVKDFKFENYPNPVMKVRRPAHLAMKDSEYLNDYKTAVAIMRSLPLSDPRCHMQQAKAHCAYCDGAYPVLDHPDQRLFVHANWLFAPFHRWFLYFYERILGKLINKPDFALPFWNWDHPDGMRIPEMFKDMGSSLYTPNRNKDHLSRVVDLSYHEAGGVIPDDKQIQENLLLMRKQMLYPTKPEVFFGVPYRSGDESIPNVGAGALEFSPHNNLHTWTGSETINRNMDMGRFRTAARDPIFYCHHANVDRMWSIWRNDLPGRSRVDFSDPDYLNAYFVFYDENAFPVKVYVRDTFDTEKLGYKYEQVDLPWMSKRVTIAKQKLVQTAEPVSFPRPLDSVIRTKVARPMKLKSKKEKEDQEEVLVINFELGDAMGFVKFDVYVNDDYDHSPNEKTQVKPEYAGSFTSLTHGMGAHGKKKKKAALRLALNNLLEEIGAADDDFIVVTLVPNSGTDNLIINDVNIKLIS